MPCTDMLAPTNRGYLLVLTFMTVVFALYSSVLADASSDNPSTAATSASISPTATTNETEWSSEPPDNATLSYSTTSNPISASSVESSPSNTDDGNSSSSGVSTIYSSNVGSTESLNITSTPTLDATSNTPHTTTIDSSNGISSSKSINTIPTTGATSNTDVVPTFVSSTESTHTTPTSDGSSYTPPITSSLSGSLSSVDTDTTSMPPATLATSAISGTSSATTSFTDSISITPTPPLQSSPLYSSNDTDASTNTSTTISTMLTVSTFLTTDAISPTNIPSSPVPTTTYPTSTPTTTTPTTTEAPTTISTRYEPVEGNKATAIFTVSFELVFYCTSFNITTIRNHFAETTFFQSTTFSIPRGSCSSNGRRKRATSSKTATCTIATKVPANSVDSFINETENVVRSLTLLPSINITKDSMADFLENIRNQSSDLCKADNFCPSGFRCKNANTTTCYFLCDANGFSYDCGNGECYVEVDYQTKHHGRKCRCNIDEFYQYEGDKCDTKKMTWQMILAIAGGCAAAIIVILIFIIIITCMRKKRRSNGYNKYSNGSELHYTDLHNRSTTRTYQGLRPSTDRANTGNAQGYENKAYDYRDYIEVDNDLHYRSGANGSRATNGSHAMTESHNRDWNPDESADVYAKLNTRFDDVNYQYNIKRAQLRKSGTDTDVRTGF